MNAADIITALDLPDDARVGRRVPKRLLVENGTPAAGDGRRIEEGVEELVWVAALKPTTIGVPEYRDDVREYLEISVLRLGLHPGAKGGRLIELVHRAVPYPVLLIAEQEGLTNVSAVHKRWSEGESGKTVLDGEMAATRTNATDPACGAHADPLPPFYRALALGRQPRASLYTLYQGWIDALVALDIAWITGTFGLPVSCQAAVDRRDALREYTKLEAEIARLRTAAEKETQIPHQVDLNLEIRRLLADQAGSRERMQTVGTVA